MAEYEVPEKTENRRERVVGLLIACIAVVLAIVSAIGHDTKNEQILAHVDASDQFNFYQAKKERFFLREIQAEDLGLIADRLSPTKQVDLARISVETSQDQQRLGNEMKDIQAKGDDFMKEAERLGKKSKVLDLGEIALQISIVMCSITILTEQRLFAFMGAVMAAIGVAVALWGILLG